MNYAEENKTKEKLDKRWPMSGVNYSMPQFSHVIVIATDSSKAPKYS